MQDQQLTFHIASDIRIRTLVLVNQLDDAQQILLLELLQGLGNLLVVVLLGALLAHEALLLGPLFVGRQGSRLTKPLLERLRRVLENDGVRNLVLFLLEVEIVDDGSQLSLLRSVEVDTNLKLTPTLVGADEGGLGEGCSGGFMSESCGRASTARVQIRAQTYSGRGSRMWGAGCKQPW